MPDNDLVNKLFDEIHALHNKIDTLPALFVLKEVFELNNKQLQERLNKLEEHQQSRYDKFVSRVAVILSILSALYVLAHYIKW